MKKILLLAFLGILIVNPTFADKMNNIEYKELKENSKILFNSDLGIWSQKINRKTPIFYVKKDMGDGTSLFVNIKDGYAFSTNCQYEFLNKGLLIGYSNNDLKFYSFTLNDNILEKNELSLEEIQALFPKYQIIKISQFSKNTNSLKIKKNKSNFKIILLNDTEQKFYNYEYSSNNAEFEEYEQRGFLNITKSGMILFSNNAESTQESPWYVLLIR